MRNKKLTPQQKLLKRKKMIERQEKKIINELKLEEQQILEQQKHQNYIDGIKNKMDKIGDIGNLYHITCIDRGNKILNTGLKGGNNEISDRHTRDNKKRKDTFGRIFFIDSENPRMWNGVGCSMIDPVGEKERVKKLDEIHKRNSYLMSINPREHAKQMVDDICEFVENTNSTREMICLSVPKSYFKVMGIEIEQDGSLDWTNTYREQKYVKSENIPSEFISLESTFKFDSDDWDLDYKWKFVRDYMNNEYQEDYGMIYNRRDMIVIKKFESMDYDYSPDKIDFHNLKKKDLFYLDKDNEIITYKNKEEGRFIESFRRSVTFQYQKSLSRLNPRLAV